MRGRIRDWVMAARPQFLTITAVAVCLGWASAWAGGAGFSPGTALATLLGALCVHAGANLVNDYHDRDADAENDGRIAPYTGGGRAIQDALLTPLAVACGGYALVGAAVLAGIGLSFVVGAELLAVGTAGLLLGIAYSAPPLRLSARGCGEAAVAGAWLLVVVGADMVQRTHWSWQPLLAGVPVALLVAAILWVNELPDRAADARSGKRTLVVRLGRRAALRVLAGLVIVPYAWLFAVCMLGAVPLWGLLGAISLPISLAASVRLLRDADASLASSLPYAIRATILAAHVHGIALAAGLLLARGAP